jgi:hypothetical protein
MHKDVFSFTAYTKHGDKVIMNLVGLFYDEENLRKKVRNMFRCRLYDLTGTMISGCGDRNSFKVQWDIL